MSKINYEICQFYEILTAANNVIVKNGIENERILMKFGLSLNYLKPILLVSRKFTKLFIYDSSEFRLLPEIAVFTSI